MEQAEVDFLTDPFSQEFVVQAAITAALVGILCAVVGCFVVLRGLALMADSLAHGVLPGVAIAFMITANRDGLEPDRLAITTGALIAGLVTAAGTSAILRRSRLNADTAAAVAFVFMLSLGVVLISRVEGYAVDLNSFLFGDVLASDGSAVMTSAVLCIVVLAAVAILYRPLLLLSFDAKRAAALGVPVKRIETLLMVLMTIAVVAGFLVVGSLLVLGMLLAPPAAGALIARRLPGMMFLSAAIAAVSAPLGLLASWHLDLAAGASIVLVAVSAFILIALVRGSRI
jgi:ABC-type Mn2+/Zn2+ transport system permease subunit